MKEQRWLSPIKPPVSLGAIPRNPKVPKTRLKALKQFAGQQQVKLLYTDGAKEYEAACERLQWTHDVSTPNRPQTNGVAERNVQRIIDGTRVVLEASGLDHSWWPEASECFCCLNNVTHSDDLETTPYETTPRNNFRGMPDSFWREGYFQTQWDPFE